MLIISASTESLTQSGKVVVGVGGDSRTGRDGSKLDGSEIDDSEIGGGKVDDEVGKKS